MIGEGGVKVSGGEKQRLSIARALLRRPHLMVFDEATSSLDSLTEEEIGQTIREVGASEDVMTILIAHRLSTIMHADRIYVLERGSITESGTHAQLLDEKGLYYAMWRQQIGEKRAALAPAAAGRWRSGPWRNPDRRHAVVGRCGRAQAAASPAPGVWRRVRRYCQRVSSGLDLSAVMFTIAQW